MGRLLPAALCLFAASAACADSTRLDLAGDWYVLVHARDRTSADPDAVLWEDAIWRFERRGDRLHWTLHPSPHFENARGRGQPGGAWQPDAAQRDEIARGLRVGRRGVLRASLEGSDSSGWRSAPRAPSGASPSVLGFERAFAIEGLPDRPVFTRSEALTGAGAEDLEGRTRFETGAVDPGPRLVGRFERDGVERGRFQMWRAGAPVVGGRPR